jgi:manganese/zinc/iron transport system substrate-binding protein
MYYLCTMLKSYISLTFILILTLFGCTEPQQNSKITIVTTTGILGDCIANLVGENAEVISLMGPGVDPHLYKASQGDIAKLGNADIIVYNGLHLEGKMAQMLKNYSKTKPCYAIGDYVAKENLKPVDSTGNLHDPHIWFAPQIWVEGLEGIAKELAKNQALGNVDSAFTVYKTEILKTEKDLKNRLDMTLAKNKRILITSHDAFSYFGDAFEFKVRGLQGISTAAEYGARDVKDLIDFIITNEVRSVFVESSISDRNLKAVVAGAKARNYPLQIGGTLYSDALGEANTEAGTYVGMLISNVNTISKGLIE